MVRALGPPAGSLTALPCKLGEAGVRVFVRVTPKSQQETAKGLAAGPDGPWLEVKVRAAPENGAANEAAIRVIAALLEVPKRSVSLASGATSRYKAFDIVGDPGQLADRLQQIIARQNG